MKKPLKPKPLIDRFAETYALTYGIRDVLDIGSGEGRNALRLASHFGMNVLGLDLDPSAVEYANTLARRQNIGAHFEVGDGTAFREGMVFDAVFSNETLHLIPKLRQNEVLQNMRNHTAKGGFNVVSGYLVRPGDERADTMFVPGELSAQYDSNWRVHESLDLWQPDQTLSTGEIVTSSLTEIIVQRIR